MGLRDAHAYFRGLATRVAFGMAAFDETDPERREKLIGLWEPFNDPEKPHRSGKGYVQPALKEACPEMLYVGIVTHYRTHLQPVLATLHEKGQLDEETKKRAHKAGSELLDTLHALS